MAAVTAVFAGTLVGGLHYMGALDPSMLRGPNDPDPARAGWKTHSLEQAGFSIQLPPEWEGTPGKKKAVFRAFDGKVVVATLTVVQADKPVREMQSPTSRRVMRGSHALTFTTSERYAASFGHVFDEAARSFKEL